MSMAGPSNIPGTSIQTYSNSRSNSITVMKCSDSSNKKLIWKCIICQKDLSSKRSYTEHMNIHNKSRPFRCDSCDYASASQMTLHRHKLRNHTPKTKWGYRCPYCEDVYMEPAGYQQHVQHRHVGLSATYGCPLSHCKFSSKSQRHFLEHVTKHDSCEKLTCGIDNWMSQNQLTRYMISDECGFGFDNGHFRTQIMVRPRVIRPVAVPSRVIYKPVSTNSSSVPISVLVNQKTTKGVLWQVDKSRNSQYSQAASTQNINQRHVNVAPRSDVVRINMNGHVANNHIRSKPTIQYIQPRTVPITPKIIHPQIDEEEDDDDEGPPVLDRQQEEETLIVPDTNWIEAEIEVASNDVPMFPNGFMEEELD